MRCPTAGELWISNRSFDIFAGDEFNAPRVGCTEPGDTIIFVRPVHPQYNEPEIFSNEWKILTRFGLVNAFFDETKHVPNT